MDLLFLEAKPIPSHAIAAMLAVILGAIQLMREKGTAGHKALGWAWMLLMLYVSVSSFFISEIQLWGAFSPIHLLSIWTIISIVGAIYFARVGDIARHKLTMQLLYVLALIVTGLIHALARSRHASGFVWGVGEAFYWLAGAMSAQYKLRLIVMQSSAW